MKTNQPTRHLRSSIVWAVSLLMLGFTAAIAVRTYLLDSHADVKKQISTAQPVVKTPGVVVQLAQSDDEDDDDDGDEDDDADDGFCCD